MEALQRIKARLKTEKKVWIPVCIGILAIFLLALSEFLPQGQTESKENTISTESEDAYCEALENRLAAVISEVENAVCISAAYSEYVLIDGAGGDAGMVLRTQTPEVQGVIVVCDGANLPEVAGAITQAVSTALGVGTDRVSILKMKPEEE